MQISKISLILVTLYQRTLSSTLVLLFGTGCRYDPTCSQYCKDSIKKYGIFRGTMYTGKRLSHCHPWGGSGYDPA